MNAGKEAQKKSIPLVLGTVQLGMDYGVANRRGKPDLKEAVDIIRTAWENGIHFFDTAQAYGSSERVLGHCFRELGLSQDQGLKINTKLNPSVHNTDENAIIESVSRSLEALGVERLWGLMLHGESLLNEPIDVYREAAVKLKAKGRIDHFGISLYSAEKALSAFAIEEMEAVQLPFNVFDQRALEHNLFEYAAANRKHLFVRSVYLQGLLLMDLNQLPPMLEFSRGALESFHSFAERQRTAPKLLSLGFVSQKARNARIIIGAESAEQVRENVSSYHVAAGMDLPDMSSLSSKDLRLIDPSNWQLKP